jgi:hypothetical protein
MNVVLSYYGLDCGFLVVVGGEIEEISSGVLWGSDGCTRGVRQIAPLNILNYDIKFEERKATSQHYSVF